MRSEALRVDESVQGLILDQCPDLFTLLDAHGLILYANPAHFVRLGRDTDALSGASILDLIHPKDAQEFERFIALSSRRQAANHRTARWLRQDGKALAFESIAKWIAPEDGGAEQLLLCSREITKPSSQAVRDAELAAQLRGDAARLLNLAEGDKKHIARAIHDTLGQSLTAFSLELAVWKTELDSGQSMSVSAVREKIAGLTDALAGAVTFTRALSSKLRPRVLEEFGLSAALEWQLDKVEKRSGVICRFSSDREARKLRIEPFLAAQIFHIAGEVIELRALAGGKSLQLRLIAREDALTLIFEDGGVERRLTQEICSRVRLLGGELHLNDAGQTILITVPRQMPA